MVFREFANFTSIEEFLIAFIIIYGPLIIVYVLLVLKILILLMNSLQVVILLIFGFDIGYIRLLSAVLLSQP